jgi:hypothetical protein
MKQFEFRLNITADQYVHHYSGLIRQVVAKCADGRNVQFPASLLRKHITSAGIHGYFVLTCDDSHTDSTLQRIGS